MKIYSFILLQLLLSSALAHAQKEVVSKIAKPKLKDGEIAIFFNSKYSVIRIKELNGLKFDEATISRPSSDAIKATKTKLSFPSAPHSAMQNPAAQYCSEHGGQNLIAISSSGGEVNYCRFKDRSLINSWDLFYKHFPN